MNKFTKVSLYILSAVILISGCKKDDYYERPDGLADPIYQVLQQRGNFTSLLKLIDKAGYTTILGKDGSWTMFAANDAAYQKYFTENNTSLDKIDSAEARRLVLYTLVYNPFRKDQLTSTQSGALSTSPLLQNTSFRRQTAFYDFVYTEGTRKIFNNGTVGSVYTASVNNNKWIPYFITSYLDANLLTPDYAKLYPGAGFSGFNVADAKVVTADIPAENGLIHEIDKVVPPLPSLDQYVASKPEYSEFKKLLDKVAVYTQNDVLSQRYKILTGKSDPVFLKYYSGILISPNVEVGSQVSTYSMVVPTNQQLKAYTDEVLENYVGKSFDSAPVSVLTTFLNSHLWNTTLWPSRLTTEPNALKETPNFSASNVVDTKVLSNGNFYGLNKVQEPNAFRSVYGRAFLNPNYSLQTQAYSSAALNFTLQTITPTNPFQYTTILLSDAALNANGYFYDPNFPAWGYGVPGVATMASATYDATALSRITRVTNTIVLKTPYDELANPAGEGVAETIGGEYVKFKAGKLQAAGNVVDNTSLTIAAADSKVSANGRAFYPAGTGILKFPEDAVLLSTTISALAGSTDANVNTRFSHWWNYLKNNTGIYNVGSTGAIKGVDFGSLYTVFIPTNAAIETAVKAGLLPGNTSTGVPNFTYTSYTAAQITQVNNLINYSIIPLTTVAVDGKKADTYQTLAKKVTGEVRTITLSYTAGEAAWNSSIPLTIKDDSGTTTTTNFQYSNNLGNRALIHSINNVLKF